MKNRRTAALFALAAAAVLATSGSATAQVFKDRMVQSPSIGTPERGSVGGALAGLGFSPTEVARGSFSMPLPVELPQARGPLLASIVPGYSPDGGQSEWGMGWSTALSIKRFRVIGDLDFASDDLIGPWGRMVKGSDGAFYPLAHAGRVRVVVGAGGYVATLPDGTQYAYRASDAVAGSGGTYAWMLSEVTTLLGDRTTLQWTSNASGRRFLTSVTYGGRTDLQQYSIGFSYDTLAQPFVSYEGGAPLVLDRRVKQILVKVRPAGTGDFETRWRYELGYTPAPFGPAFYLSSIRRHYRSGEADPPTVYGYNLDDQRLRNAPLVPYTGLDDYLTRTGDDAVQPDRAALHDFDRDGRLDLENAVRQTLVRHTDAGWVYEALPIATGTNSKCRPPAYKLNKPRNLVRLIPDASSPHVLYTELKGAIGKTQVLICDRLGRPLADNDFTGDWQLGANVKLVDINRDRRPDLVHVDPTGIDILENRSDATGLRFVPLPRQSIAFGFSPTATFIEDMNGDGLADLVLRRSDGISVFYGLGGAKFDTTAVPFVIYGAQGGAITALETYATSFVDANKDGLEDLLLSVDRTVFLFTNRGGRFIEVPVAGFAAVNWTFGVPVVADLSGNGNVEVSFAATKKGYVVDLANAATGLMAWSSDGKGNVARFDYDRSQPTASMEQRIIVLRTLTIESSGYDPVTWEYEYENPISHTVSGSLLGFQVVRRLAPQLMEEVTFHHDDEVSGIALESVSTDSRTDLIRFTKASFESRRYREIGWWRQTAVTSGWRRLDGTGEISETTESLAYEREFCATISTTTSRHGVVTAESILGDPAALVGLPHCITRLERLTGRHTDSDLDFDYILEADRNEFGQPTQMRQNGPTGTLVLQSMVYGAQHRLTETSQPGLGTTRATYDPATGLVVSTTRPDEITTRVSAFDPMTDAVRDLGIDRGPAATYTSYFRYDGLERLWKSWDDVGIASESNPEEEFAYGYARQEGPGFVWTKQLAEAGTWRASATLSNGAGEAVTGVARIPQGWATGGVARRDRSELETRTYRRSPLASDTDLAAIRWDQLMSGTTLLATGRTSGFGQGIFARSTLQAGVVHEMSSASALVDDTIVTTTSESGGAPVQMGNDLGGRALWGRDAAGNVTTFAYDALGRLIRVELPDGAVHRITFDAYGRPAMVEREGLQRIEYSYEVSTGLPSCKTVRGGDGDAFRKVSWTRDAIGRVQTEQHTNLLNGAQRVFRWRYDGETPDGVLAGQRGYATTEEGDGYSVVTEYNRDGSPKQKRMKLGSWREVIQEWTYREDGSAADTKWTVLGPTGAQRHVLRQQEVLDSYGRLAAIVVDGAPVASFNYDAEGRVERVDIAGGQTIAYYFDETTGATKGYWQDGSLWNGGVEWSMSQRGKIASETISFGDQSWARQYEYDARGFLTRSNDRDGESTYSYGIDGLPNSTKDQLGTREYVRNGRLLTAGEQDYEYDALGRIVRRGPLNLEYGPSGEVDLARSEGHEWGYIYGASGDRLYKTRNGTPAEAYLGGGYLDEERLIVPVTIGGRIIGVFDIKGGVREFQLLATDPRSTVLGTNGVANLPSPFGVRVLRPDQSRALDFVSRGYDSDLGTVRFGVRDYDPYLGQFWTPDPLYLESLSDVASSPVQGNLYGYAMNDPLSFTDPTGMEAGVAGNGDHIEVRSESDMHFMLDSYQDTSAKTFHEERREEDGKTYVMTFLYRNSQDYIVPGDQDRMGMPPLRTWHRYDLIDKQDVTGLFDTVISDFAGAMEWVSVGLSFVGLDFIPDAVLTLTYLVGGRWGDAALAGASIFLPAAGAGALKKLEKYASNGADGTHSLVAFSGAAGKNSSYVDDLSHVTGRTGEVRTAMIEETIARHLPNLKLTHVPQYNPFLEGAFGVAKYGSGSQLGKSAFNSQKQLIETIVHEELHHRWWARGILDNPHLRPALDAKFEATVQRYMRMAGHK